MNEQPIEIRGGKMFVGGVELQRLDCPANCSVVSGTVNGEQCVISAGDVYLGSGVDYRYVGSVPYADFKAWRDGENEEI